MKFRFIIPLLSVFFPAVMLSQSAFAQPKPKVEFDQATLETEIGKERSVQGTAIHGDFLFSLRDRGSCVVTDLKHKTLVSEFRLSVYHKENHANDAFFGPDKYDPSDIFPLLYVSQCKGKPAPAGNIAALDTLDRLCYVERILTDNTGKPVGTQLVQILAFAPSEWNSRLWMQDSTDPDHVWIYGNIKGNEVPGNRIVFEKLKFPRFDKNTFLVKLSDEAILEKFYVDETLPQGARGPQNNIIQGACIHNGILFMPVGTGSAKHPSELFVVDLEARKGVRLDYTEEIPVEMEDMDIWGKRIVCTTNSRTEGRKVYTFPLAKLSKTVK